MTKLDTCVSGDMSNRRDSKKQGSDAREAALTQSLIDVLQKSGARSSAKQGCDSPSENKIPSDIMAITRPVLKYDGFGHSKYAWTSQLMQTIDTSLFKTVDGFTEKSGIYVYKRPVRTGAPELLSLLEQAGTVFHHVAVYLQYDGDSPISMLEYGPDNDDDITAHANVEVPCAPVLNSAPPEPEKECLPMLHINVDPVDLDAAHVRAAIEFASQKKYQALRRNCIAFADFMIRVLTHNRVKHAPLVFDVMCGKVPQTDSPLLHMLYLMERLTWFDICDGGRLMREFLASVTKEHVEGFLSKAQRKDVVAPIGLPPLKRKKP